MNDILIGKGSREAHLLGRYANRHGLVAGATGTGKSVSLMVLAEGFSKLGVPVFLADAKGDLAGLSQAAGPAGAKLQARIAQLGIDWSPGANPVVFWDIYGEQGHPVRATVSEMGPNLLARLMELNDTQAGVLEIVFRAADDEGLLLLDLKDLRALLAWAGENVKELSRQYGLVSPASLAAIQRALLSLDQAGGERFFGEPALDLGDLMRQDFSGRGVVNILAADRLILKPKLYTTFLLWLLSELFERLPEVGDLDVPKLVFFFDEAHLLFDNASAALLEQIEQVVRLIRSKGVGIFFITQSPKDIPETVLAQLGQRVQHALRAFTPDDEAALRAAARTFPKTAFYNVPQTLTSLGTGEALVTTLTTRGTPTPPFATRLIPPRSRMGPLTDAEWPQRLNTPQIRKYAQAVDNESAREMLAARLADTDDAAPTGRDPAPAGSGGGLLSQIFGSSIGRSVLRTAAVAITGTLVRDAMGVLKPRRTSRRR